MLRWILIGALTWYGPGFYGEPLRCSTPGNPMYYTGDADSWIAVDDELFVQGWQCGDRVKVTFADGKQAELLLLDSGYLHRYYIEDYGPEIRIIGDLPRGAWPYSTLSTTGQILNLSLAKREFEKMTCQ